MQRNNFVTDLRSGQVLLMDGAMGTELQRRNEAFTLDQNDLHGERVSQIHSSYTAAGAEVLLTNTFQVNLAALAKRGLAERHHELWQAAIDRARRALPSPRYLLADVGPIENCTEQMAVRIFDECQTVDGVLLETWTSIDALKLFMRVNKASQPHGVPVLVSFTFFRNPKGELTTFENASPETCARAAQESGVRALGANCGKEIDMADMLEIVQRYQAACDLPIFVRPNAGTPKRTESGWEYPRSPSEMAAGVSALLDLGVAMIGGCCGTTPDHIRQFRAALDRWRSRSEVGTGHVP